MAAAVEPLRGHRVPSPFHFGEQRVQNIVGTREVAERTGRAFIRKFLNDQAKQFFEELPLWFVGSRATDGSLWATTLSGHPGFIKTLDDFHFTVKLKQVYGDPVEFKEGDSIGSVGVMLHNRRRNRLNGVVESLQPGQFIFNVTQSFGNCPKYIQVRHIKIDSKKLATLGVEERPVTQGTTALGPEQRALIIKSDTLWLATGYFGIENGADGVNGCDCNHRGGAPGFVQVLGEGTLRWPDYIGNNQFMSFGNLMADPRAGIEFIDFDNGDTLQLTGHAKILWNERSLPGAQRTVEFIPTRWVHVKGGLPIYTEGPVELSPYNPVPAIDGKAGLSGLKCLARRQETPDIATFEFDAAKRDDGRPFCVAGQFASFDFPTLKKGETLNRTWTISSPPKQIAETGRFTISIKKAGLVSTYMHEHVKEMTELVFRGVDGDFTLCQATKCTPPSSVLLIAGGIGVTPIRAMFHVCMDLGIAVTVLYSVRCPEDAAFLKEFQEGAAADPNVRLALTLTGVKAEVPGVKTFFGRINAAMIKEVCPDVKDRNVFQCGPEAMMAAALSDLESLGVSSAQVHQESFNF